MPIGVPGLSAPMPLGEVARLLDDEAQAGAPRAVGDRERMVEERKAPRALGHPDELAGAVAEGRGAGLGLDVELPHPVRQFRDRGEPPWPQVKPRPAPAVEDGDDAEDARADRPPVAVQGPHGAEASRRHRVVQPGAERHGGKDQMRGAPGLVADRQTRAQRRSHDEQDKRRQGDDAAAVMRQRVIGPEPLHPSAGSARKVGRR